MKKSFAVKLILTWSLFCALWMIYNVGLDLMALVRNGDAGGYGIGVDKKLLVMVSAIPLQLVSAVTLMDAGRKAALLAESLIALGYCFVGFVLWRNMRLAKIAAVSFFLLNFLLLAVHLGYVVPMFWAAWGASLGVFAIAIGSLFLAANGWAVIYLLLLHSKRLAPSPI